MFRYENSIGVNIFSKFEECREEYGDIISETMAILRGNDLVSYGKTILETLKMLFSDSSNFREIKRLARRFALSFGLNLRKIRHAIVDIHVMGLEFAKEDPDSSHSNNFVFLEILAEFSFKLLRSDKKIQLEMLKSCFDLVSFRNDERMRPLKIYETTLKSAHAKNTTATSKSQLSQLSMDSDNIQSESRNSDSTSNESDLSGPENDFERMESTRVVPQMPPSSSSSSSRDSSEFFSRNVRRKVFIGNQLGNLAEEGSDCDNESNGVASGQTGDNLLDGFYGNSTINRYEHIMIFA